MSNPQELFQQVLWHVAGAALTGAGYLPEENPMHHARGLFRFVKAMTPEQYTFIEFQTLYHPQSELSRFGINLLRNNQSIARKASPLALEHSLPHVIWHVYGARVLPSDNHWWLYKGAQDLAYELVEAGKLLFGYGVPWLEDHPTAE